MVWSTHSGCCKSTNALSRWHGTLLSSVWRDPSMELCWFCNRTLCWAYARQRAGESTQHDLCRSILYHCMGSITVQLGQPHINICPQRKPCVCVHNGRSTQHLPQPSAPPMHDIVTYASAVVTTAFGFTAAPWATHQVVPACLIPCPLGNVSQQRQQQSIITWGNCIPRPTVTLARKP